MLNENELGLVAGVAGAVFSLDSDTNGLGVKAKCLNPNFSSMICDNV